MYNFTDDVPSPSCPPRQRWPGGQAYHGESAEAAEGGGYASRSATRIDAACEGDGGIDAEYVMAVLGVRSPTEWWTVTAASIAVPGTDIHLVSARVGNLQCSYATGELLDQLWVR